MTAVGAPFTTAHATVLHVPAQYLSIQPALNAASPGDTVQVGPGVYTGGQNKNLHFDGKPLLLRSTAGADATVIDCEENGRGFNCASEAGRDLWLEAGNQAHFYCSALDPQGIEGPGSWTTDGQETSEPPQFCNPVPCLLAPTGDGSYKLSVDSPYAPANSPCGTLIGARPVASIEENATGSWRLPEAVCETATEVSSG